MAQKILFLMSDTGGGHRAAADAIAEAIHYLYPGRFTTIIEDIWTNRTPWPINRIPGTYPWLTGPGLPLWKLMWIGSTRLPIHKLFLPLLSPVLAERMARYLTRIKPDIVVSVHPFMNHLGIKWLKRAGLQSPLITVVTDLVSIHPLWICPQATRCLVPTDEARIAALRWGMPAEKISVCGQPVSLKFTQLPGDKARIRLKLGLDVARRTVLIVGGGEGFGRLDLIARAISDAAPEAQLMVVCGRNRALRARLEAMAWPGPTHIYGFVDNMPELMAAADLLATKAGPGTISEAFIAGLPMIIYGYIPGQEEGNVAYVLKHQTGVYAQSPQQVTVLTRALLNPANPALGLMARRATGLARPDASLKIAATICEETSLDRPETIFSSPTAGVLRPTSKSKIHI